MVPSLVTGKFCLLGALAVPSLLNKYASGYYKNLFFQIFHWVQSVLSICIIIGLFRSVCFSVFSTAFNSDEWDHFVFAQQWPMTSCIEVNMSVGL